MTSKDEDLYIQLLTNINEFAFENGIDFIENSNLEIITDFELAPINAINEVFNFAIHSACFFHFTRSIYRKIQNVGLSNKYQNDDKFNLLARKIPVLAFLPVNLVKDVCNNLKLEFSNDKNEQLLVSYFEENYILGKMKMRYRNSRTPKRHEPIFPPEMWSVSSRTLTGIPRTSNSAFNYYLIIRK